MALHAMRDFSGSSTNHIFPALPPPPPSPLFRWAGDHQGRFSTVFAASVIMSVLLWGFWVYTKENMKYTGANTDIFVTQSFSNLPIGIFNSILDLAPPSQC